MGVLYWMFWGLSPMWLGDAIFEYMELQVKYFTPDPVDMLNGTILERTTEVVHTPAGRYPWAMASPGASMNMKI